MEKLQVNLHDMESYFVNESFRTLRANMQFCGKDNKLIVVTSCDANEGKTSVSLMLAKSLADAGKKTIYVDCDLRKSVVASKYVSAKGSYGISEFLAGFVDKEEVIRETDIENLYMALSGHSCPNPVELMSRGEFSQLLSELKETFDYVIVDTPPLGLVIDSAEIAKHCDSAILVIGVGNVRYVQARRIKEQLEKSGCRILGVVLNYVDKKGEKYYKQYNKKYYGKAYYKSYEETEE